MAEDDQVQGAGANEMAQRVEQFQLAKQLAKMEDDLKKEAQESNYAIKRALTQI